MYKIQTMNRISAEGLSLFPREKYEVAGEILNPDAVIARSADMHSIDIPASVRAIARAGAGVNNIPVAKCTERGIVVFNTPGANANAVKELVLAALLFSSRPVIKASKWVESLAGKGDEIPTLAEKGKAQFVGPEIQGKTLGVIGLGAIGSLVANAAVALGMNVIGHDPFISVDAAWSLSRSVARAESLDSLLAKSDYITIHAPQTDSTKGFINAEKIALMKNGARLLNFSRGGLVVNGDVVAAVKSGKIACFVTDFSDEALINVDNIICLPHLGASTPEAEENCARMAVRQLIGFLENGSIVNSVNFPKCCAEGPVHPAGTRLCIANKNIPNMIGQITGAIAAAHLNISSMTNQNRAEIAYSLIDLDGPAGEEVTSRILSIEGVISVRAILGAELSREPIEPDSDDD